MPTPTEIHSHKKLHFPFAVNITSLTDLQVDALLDCLHQKILPHGAPKLTEPRTLLQEVIADNKMLSALQYNQTYLVVNEARQLHCRNGDPLPNGGMLYTLTQLNHYFN